MNSENDPRLDEEHIRFLQGRHVDGLLLALANDRRRATIDVLRNVKVPFVAVDRELSPRLLGSAVVSDHRSGMIAAVRRLVELGHRRIGLISGDSELMPVRERFEGAKEVLEEAGRAYKLIQAGGSFSAEHGYSATNWLLDLAEPPTAIIVGGNQLLPGCLRALKARGTRVGPKLSLVTCDDVSAGEFFDPPIAAISRDTFALGRVAAEVLLRCIKDQSQPETVILPTTFIERPSVQPVTS
jgi:LacI family transcriptional regulator